MNRVVRPRCVALRALALASIAAAVTPAWSQQEPNLARGLTPGEVYDFSDVDSVNLFNGNLNVVLPVGPRYPVGDGFGYRFILTYNINLWRFDEVLQQGQTYVRATPRKTNSGFGWRVGLGGVLYAPGHPDGQGGFRFESEDGSDHRFRNTLHLNEPFEQNVAYTRDGSYLRLLSGPGNHKRIEAPDGIVREFEPEPLVPYTYRLVEMRDRLGNWVRVSYSTSQWVVSDTHGRQHTVTLAVVPGSGGETRVTGVKLDRTGSNVAEWKLTYTAGNVRVSCKDSEPRPPGAPPEKRFAVPLLTALTMPDADQSAWSMESYNTECVNGVKDAPGTLARLRLPTRGILEWDYQTYGFLTRTGPGSPISSIYTHSAGVQRKRTLNAAGQCDHGAVDPACTWTYRWEHLLSELSRKTVVRTPLGDEAVYYFAQKWDASSSDWSGWDYGLPYRRGQATRYGDLYLSQELYDGSEGGTKLRSVYVLYEHDQLSGGANPSPPSWHDSNRRVVAQRTHYEDDRYESPGGSGNFVPRFTEERWTDFDGVGRFRDRTASGDLVGAGNPAVRTERTEYNPASRTYQFDQTTNLPGPKHNYLPWTSGSAWVLGNYTASRATEAGSAVASQACHEASTGRLTRQRFQVGAASLATGDVIIDYTRVRTTVDGKPATVYQELSYGGDTQSVSTGTSLCTLTLPSTPVYRTRHTDFYGVRARTEALLPGGGTMNLRTLDLAIDLDTGLTTSSTDPAGLTTSYQYDLLGRLAWAKPASGGDAWTEIVHDAAAGATTPAKVTVNRRPNGSPTGTKLGESVVVYDPFGRVKRDERKLPGAVWTAVETGYNALGWKTYVTKRGRSPGSLPHRTWFSNHDPFGRPTKIQLPDHPSDNRHFIKLTYAGARAVTREVSIASNLVGGETRATTVELYDHLGRLFRVWEPSAPGGSSTNTNYFYDAAGRLTSARLLDTDGFVQRRDFSYDGRGFLLSETHPENGLTIYSVYDPRGHAGRKRTGVVNGPFDLLFTYDSAERLTQVSERGSGRLLKEFTYGTGTTAADRSKNKIKTAARHNHVRHPDNGNQLDVSVTETYTYGGIGGRPSLRTTALTTGQSFSQAWTYDHLGQVSLLTYPTCTHPGSTCSSGAGLRPRTVGFTYQLGYLTAVPGWASTITYHANGMLNEITHANGVIYQQGLDPHWMRRPASLGVTHPNNLLELAPGALAVPLPYAYDGAGNVKSWFDWRYRYDGVSRVLEGTVVDANGGTHDSQSYTFDTYGNIRSITTRVGNAAPQTVQLGVDRTTNRLSASLYDAAGNLTSRGGFAYGYDALSMMQTMAGGGNDGTYIYTADDERIWAVEASSSSWSETFTLRDLDGKALRVFTTTTGFGALAWSQDYVHRDGQLLATARVNGLGETRHHFHLNHLGTPLLITNPQGGSEQLHSYFPFGEELFPDRDAERMKFTGHERDLNRPGQADDLDYMHARYCSPLLGRFLSVDPHTQRAPSKRPLSWNRYSYTRGNPMVLIDPDGREVKPPRDRRTRKALEKYLTTPAGLAAYNILETAPGIYEFKRKRTSLNAVDRFKLRQGQSVVKQAGHFVGTYRVVDGKVEWVSGGKINIDYGIVDRATEGPYAERYGDTAILSHEMGHALGYETAEEKLEWIRKEYEEKEEEADEHRDEVIEQLTEPVLQEPHATPPPQARLPRGRFTPPVL